MQSQYGKRLRQGLAIGGILSLGLLAQCGKKEEPPPPPQAEKPSALPGFTEQYKAASKATAEDPGLAASPGKMKKEEEKSGK